MEYQSTVIIDSVACPGVQLRVRRMSFARRLELMRTIRGIADRAEFLEAGDDPRDGMDAALAAAEIQRAYVRWGVEEVIGLELDGTEATVDALIAAGPEELFREAADAVRTQCGLSEAERKN